MTSVVEELKAELRDEFNREVARIERLVTKSYPELIKDSIQSLRKHMEKRLDDLKSVPIPTLEWLLTTKGKWAVSNDMEVNFKLDGSEDGVRVEFEDRDPFYHSVGYRHPISFTKKDNGKWRLILFAFPVEESTKE